MKLIDMIKENIKNLGGDKNVESVENYLPIFYIARKSDFTTTIRFKRRGRINKKIIIRK